MDPNARIIPLRLHPLGFIEAFAELGADLTSLLRDTGIDAAMFDRGDAKISYAQQKALIQNGIDTCRQAGLGLQVGMLFDWSFHGTIGSIVTCSPSLREAGEAFHRYVVIAQPFYAMYPRRPLGYIHEKDMLIYPLRCLPAGETDQEVTRFELEFTLAVTLRFWELCGNKAVADPAVRVSLNYPQPEHVHLYRELPCTSIQFGSKHSHIAAHKDFVIQPFRELRKHAFDQVIAQCEEELNSSKLETSYAAKVRWHAYKNFNRQITLEDVATILHLTPRTLTRRLAVENTTFRNILNEVRMEMVSYHLRHSKLSVDEIAELTGFSCASSLRRAIRNWSGEPASTTRLQAASL